MLAFHAPGGEAGEPPNLALGASYRLEPAPNYPEALGETGGELTDGRIPHGRIWTSGDAVGWSWRMPVTVTLDMSGRGFVDHVRVHTASGTDAGVFYPSQILVFGSGEAGRFDFLGASRLSHDEDSSPTPTPAAVDIRFPAHQVGELVIVILARGAFAFVSEVEAFGSFQGGRTPVGTLPDRAALLQFAIEHRRAAIAALPQPRPTGPDTARRWAMPLGGGSRMPAASACSAERIDPWAGESAVPAKVMPAGGAGDTAPLTALTGGHDYAAWRIVNRSDADMPVKVDVTAPAKVGLRVFALAHVQALNFAWVPDVVVPFDGTTLPPRSAMLVLVEARPVAAIRDAFKVSIECGERAYPFDIELAAIAADLEVPPLHGNLWTYLHQPLHAPVARALACDAGFLERYGVDTVTVHPAALLGDDGDRPGALLRRYFETHRNAARILLYMDIKTRDWPINELPDHASVDWLRDWWDWVREIAGEAGVSGELLLYPIDEPRSDDLPAMMRFHDLVQDAGIEARIYATLERRTLAVLPWVDVAQLHRPSELEFRLAGLAGIREVHSYDTREDAKLLPPEGYYRRQGWDAYALGLAGVGVWSAWDSTGLASPETGWDPFTGENERDFGMLYAAPDGCAWPSLRLLAWRRGMEENRILRQCEKRQAKGHLETFVQSAAGGGSLANASRAIAEVAREC